MYLRRMSHPPAHSKMAVMNELTAPVAKRKRILELAQYQLFPCEPLLSNSTCSCVLDVDVMSSIVTRRLPANMIDMIYAWTSFWSDCMDKFLV